MVKETRRPITQEGIIHNASMSNDNDVLRDEEEYRQFTPESLSALKTRSSYLKKHKDVIKNSAAKLAIFKGVDESYTPEENEDVECEETHPDASLQNGQTLPRYCGKFPKRLYNRPIEDVDTYYRERGKETFCVVTRRFNRDRLFRFSASNVLFVLSPFHKLRHLAIRIALHSLFDIVVMIAILINCVFLALDNEITNAEYFFTAFYTVEVIIKVSARGLIMEKFTYLRDPWNWLDFAVVIVAYATITGSSDVSSLRAIRVLRALKSVAIVPGLRTIVNALFYSMKPLAEVLVIMLFLLFVVALIALQAYQGVLQRRCVLYPANMSDAAYFNYTHNSMNWNPVEGEQVVCGNATGSGICPAGYICLPDVGPNPNYGHTNFDHMGYALLTSLQLLTLDFWENVYNMIIRAEGPWNVLFFLMSVFLGPFYLLNLLLAVVTLAYVKENDKMTELKKKRAQVKERAKRRQMRKKKLQEQRNTKRLNSVAPERQQQSTVTSIGDIVALARMKAASPATAGDQADGADERVGGESDEARKNGEPRNKKSAFSSGGKQASMDSSESSNIKEMGKWEGRLKRIKTWYMTTFCAWSCHPKFESFQKKLQKVIKHKVFEIFIILCIVINTVLLAIDFHGISKELENALGIGNNVFTFVFALEATIKILGLGPLTYIKDYWNLFDFAIVVISLVEFTLFLIDPTSSLADLTMLRTLRLLRVFRLARLWGTMHKLVKIIWKTSRAVGYLTIVLFLVLYIFAVIGKQWYSVQYANSAAKFDDNEVPRWNFVDFYHSFLLVWRVMCGEWIEPLYDCMYITGNDGRCIPLFLAILFFANFMILNLFTAILLDAFDVDELQSTKKKNKGSPSESPGPSSSAVPLAIEKFKKRLKSSKSTDQQKAEEDNNLNGATAEEKGSTSNNNISGPTLEVTTVNEKNHRRQSISANLIFDLSNKAKLNNAKRKSSTNLLQTLEEVADNEGSVTGHAKTRNAGMTRQNSIDRGDAATTESPKPKARGTFEAIAECSEDCPASGNVQMVNANHNVGKKTGKKDAKSPTFDNNNGGDHRAPQSPVSSCCRMLCLCGCNKAREVEPASGDVENNAEDAAASSSSSSGRQEAEGEEGVEEEKSPTEPPSCFPMFVLNRYPSLKEPPSSAHEKNWYAFRKACFRLVEHQFFEWFILLLILASTVCLTMEDIHLDQDPLRKDILQKLEYVFTILFTMEMLLKWAGIGIFKYFTTFWCILDCGIVAASWASIIVSTQASQFRVLRAFRAFRPLRAVSRWQGMKVVVNALIYCIPSIGNVLCVCMLIWFVFGIMGVQFFKGQFFRCVDGFNNDVTDPNIVNMTQCISNNYFWVNSNINFDNVANAMVALFQVATFEGWIEIMTHSTDVAGIDMQPVRNRSQYSTIFYVIFVLIGAFFILNLIVGVIIESFQKLSKQTDSNSAVETLLTDSQKQFYKTMRTMLNRKPKKTIPPPENWFQLKFFKLVTNSRFELAIFILIVLNMATLSMEHYKMSDTWVLALRVSDITFTTMFGIEAILKLIGMRCYYFRDVFNVFDLLVVVVSITGFILERLIAFIVSPTLLRVVRVFRVFRVLRVVRAARGIRRLVLTLMISIPALFNIAVLLSVFMVIFAILGMTMFMHVKLEGALNDLVNFQTFGNSLMVLFRLVTSAGWNDVLEPLMNTRNCTAAVGDYHGDCGEPIGAVIYFVVFIFVVFLVIVNMYIAIILENFHEIFKQDESGVSQGDFETFYMVWGRYDPRATQFVTLTELSNLLHDLHPPFQLPKPNLVKIGALDLPVLYGDKVHCLDVLFALVKRILGEVEISEEMRQEAEERLLKSFPNRKTLKAETTTLVLRQQIRAAKIIQDAWKAFSARRRKEPSDHNLKSHTLQLVANANANANASKPDSSSAPSKSKVKTEATLHRTDDVGDLVLPYDKGQETAEVPAEAKKPVKVVAGASSATSLVQSLVAGMKIPFAEPNSKEATTTVNARSSSEAKQVQGKPTDAQAKGTSQKAGDYLGSMSQASSEKIELGDSKQPALESANDSDNHTSSPPGKANPSSVATPSAGDVSTVAANVNKSNTNKPTLSRIGSAKARGLSTLAKSDATTPKPSRAAAKSQVSSNNNNSSSGGKGQAVRPSTSTGVHQKPEAGEKTPEVRPKTSISPKTQPPGTTEKAAAIATTSEAKVFESRHQAATKALQNFNSDKLKNGIEMKGLPNPGREKQTAVVNKRASAL